jgi:hypothetical protein
METPQTTSFFDKAYNPMLQGSIILAVIVAIMTVVKLLHLANLLDVDGLSYWIIAGAGLLLYAIFNSVFSLAVKDDMNKYWSQSTGTYAGVMILGGGFAWLFSALPIGEAATFRWIFMVVTFGYLLFLSMMRFMRKVIAIAKREDDNWMKRQK